ncbi:MAG: flagella basal body P-ring formation protein FlgA [Vampirovibrionales bacterium]
MNRPSLFSFHILGIVFISFLGLIPNIACAEQWLEAPHLQEKVKPLLDASTQAYCQSKGLKTCDFVLGINVAATRKFRSLELLAGEAYNLSLNGGVDTSVFQQGYGSVNLVLEGTQSNRQTILVLPLVLQKQVLGWQVKEAIPFGASLVGKVERATSTVNLRDVSQLLLSDLPTSTIARTNLSKGQLITKFQVKTPPAVLMNQTVKLVVEVHQSTRPIRLVLDAQAMQNGGIGDMIKVKQSGYNHKIYLGQVQTDGTVFVKM